MLTMAALALSYWSRRRFKAGTGVFPCRVRDVPDSDEAAAWGRETTSRPVLDGFIVGLAMTVAAGQLPKLLGIEASGDAFFSDLLAVLTNLDQAVAATLALGVGSLVLLFLLGRLLPRLPAALGPRRRRSGHRGRLRLRPRLT